MKLAVVTHTRGEFHPWLESCFHSVQLNLPKNAKHIIVNCTSAAELDQARWESLNLAEYVCFVDDDDLVYNNSIQHCLDALESNPNAGVAFTNELRIDTEDNILYEQERTIQYEDASENAQCIHHLCMIRTNLVKPEFKQLGLNLGIGSEWLMKAGTALNHGAIHLPIRGYGWRKHDSQHSQSEEWVNKYNAKFHFLCAYLKAQANFSGEIPQYIM